VTQQWLWSLISTARLGYRMRLLRELLRVGRTSLVIGLATLASAIALGDFLAYWGDRTGNLYDCRVSTILKIPWRDGPPCTEIPAMCCRRIAVQGSYGETGKLRDGFAHLAGDRSGMRTRLHHDLPDCRTIHELGCFPDHKTGGRHSDSRRHDQPSFCRTLLRISSESRGSCTAQASTTPPIIDAARKLASFRSPPLTERIFSNPCSNAALISGVERSTSWASAAMDSKMTFITLLNELLRSMRPGLSGLVRILDQLNSFRNELSII
jgi:hypothetical protein